MFRSLGVAGALLCDSSTCLVRTKNIRQKVEELKYTNMCLMTVCTIQTKSHLVHSMIFLKFNQVNPSYWPCHFH